MATKKPRITVSLDKDTYEVLQAYADVFGQTMSGCVSDMVLARRDKMKIIVQKSQELDSLVNSAD